MAGQNNLARGSPVDRRALGNCYLALLPDWKEFVKTKLASRKSALSLLGAMIILAALGIVVAIIMRFLISLCHHIAPLDPPGGGGTNQIAQVKGLNEAGILDLPEFVFPEMNVFASNLTASHGLQNALMLVQRSTNLVDWETVLTTNDTSHVFLWSDDTNPPPDRAFYRMEISFPNSRQ